MFSLILGKKGCNKCGILRQNVKLECVRFRTESVLIRLFFMSDVTDRSLFKISRLFFRGRFVPEKMLFQNRKILLPNLNNRP